MFVVNIAWNSVNISANKTSFIRKTCITSLMVSILLIDFVLDQTIFWYIRNMMKYQNTIDSIEIIIQKGDITYRL